MIDYITYDLNDFSKYRKGPIFVLNQKNIETSLKNSNIVKEEKDGQNIKIKLPGIDHLYTVYSQLDGIEPILTKEDILKNILFNNPIQILLYNKIKDTHEPMDKEIFKKIKKDIGYGKFNSNEYDFNQFFEDGFMYISHNFDNQTLIKKYGLSKIPSKIFEDNIIGLSIKKTNNDMTAIAIPAEIIIAIEE